MLVLHDKLARMTGARRVTKTTISPLATVVHPNRDGGRRTTEYEIVIFNANFRHISKIVGISLSHLPVITSSIFALVWRAPLYAERFNGRARIENIQKDREHVHCPKKDSI